MGDREHQEEPGQARRLTALWKHRNIETAGAENDDCMVDVFIFDGSTTMIREVELDADYYDDISDWLKLKVMSWWNDHVINLHIMGDSNLKTYRHHEIDVNATVNDAEFELVANGTYRVGQMIKVADLGFLPLIVNDSSYGSPHTIWVLPEVVALIKSWRVKPLLSAHYFSGLDSDEHWIGSPNTTWRRSFVNPDVTITLHGENI